MRVCSAGILDGDAIPHRFLGDGGNLSPPLSWAELPPGTASLAVTCEDPRGPEGRPFCLWLLYNIPPTRSEIPEGLSKVPLSPEVPGALQAVNDTGRVGYDGPLPPHGHAHRYEFRLLALDTRIELPPGPKAVDVRRAMERHVLEVARLDGTYARP